ncbi:hypothetical protein [Streptomyces sp. NPDC003036]|uniref:hypothetical protein n=1 Tax=Streptomyces sp. NPDC003036 TaxID=3154442 RepID=UPI00339DABF0
MNTPSCHENIDWIPASGFQLRKAGVQFDAVRVDGDDGRRVADIMEHMTAGDPGPVVIEANGRRGVYFLLPPGSTAGRAWPREATPFNACEGRVSYVPVPALTGNTWPLAWRCPPRTADRFVHPVLLRSTLVAAVRDMSGT